MAAAQTRDCHRRDPASRDGVPLVGADILGRLCALADEGDVGEPVDSCYRLPDELIGQHDRGRLQRLSEVNGPLGREQAIADRLGRQHEMRASP